MIADLVIANLLRIAREDLDGASVLLPSGNRNAFSGALPLIHPAAGSRSTPSG
jgi:hypothetical protein